MEGLKALNLAVRFGMELGMLAIFGYWGFKSGGSPWMRWLLGLGAPLLAAVIWGMLMAPKAPWRQQEAASLLLEVALFGLAGLALYASGQKNLTLWFGVIYLINRALMYIWKQ